MSIHWIRDILINGEKKKLNIQLGYHHIGDRSYAQVVGEAEIWFNCNSKVRNDVLLVGLKLLKDKLANRKLQYLDGSPFCWDGK
jgi:hypothetical protein